MTEQPPPGRPAVAAPDKPRATPRRHHRHKTHAPFLPAHPLAKPGLKGHAPPADPPPPAPQEDAPQ